MQDFRSLQVLDVAEHARQVFHVVPVYRPEVADVHTLEDILLAGGDALQAVAEAYQGFPPFLVEDAHAEEQARRLEPQLVIAVRRREVEEILLHSAHAPVYGHVVIVEDDEQIVRRGRRVVQPFEGQPAAHAAIADDGHDVTVHLPLPGGGHGHAQRGRYGVGSMPADERIILAFFGRGERPDAAQLTVGVERVAASRQYFVPVGLMADIPDDAVVGRIEHIVQSHGQLHRTHAGGKMPRIGRHLFNNTRAKLAAHLRQLVHRQASQVVGAVDSVQ